MANRRAARPCAQHLEGRVRRVPVGGVEVADRRHGGDRRTATGGEAAERDRVRLGRPPRHVTVVDGVRERHGVAADVAVAVERGDRLDNERRLLLVVCRRRHRRRRRASRPQHHAMMTNAAAADEHVGGALHGVLQRHGAGLLLTGEWRRRGSAQAYGLVYRRRLGGARRDVERGEHVR